jgi:hypothetical protein
MHSHQWKEIYQFAISEQDITRLPQRITDARSAIFDRIEEMITGPGTDEKRMLNDALNGLRILQLECERQARKRAS